MRKILLVTSMIAVAALPSLASAGARCEQQQADRKTMGTVLGAIAGGFLGNAAARGGGKAGGAVIGAVGGAVVGNQLARQKGACNDDPVAYAPPPARVYRDPADYYGSDRDEAAYYRRHGHHSDGYLRYQVDVAADARVPVEDAAYVADDRAWRDSSGRLCHWRDSVYHTEDGGAVHEWVAECR